MKKNKLNYSERAKKLVFPVLLLIGFMFASSTTVSAQYKSAESSSVLVKQEMLTISDQLTPMLTTRNTPSGVSQAQLNVSYVFYNNLSEALASGNTQVALEEVYAKLSLKYNDNVTTPLLTVARNNALALLTE